jgi:hypothetical protein
MGTFLDFLEIGTSDFDTLIQKATESDVGISIDPISFYLDRLPSPGKCKKLTLAISDRSGVMPVYFVHPDQIKEHGLPGWLRGCNAIGKPHPTASRILAERGLSNDVLRKEEVRVEKLTTVLDQEKISGIYKLKVDSEGHDHIILNSFFDHARRKLWPHDLLFESNILSDSEAIHALIARLITQGYDVMSCQTGGGATNTHLRLNISRLKGRNKFTSAIQGYYLEGYPDSYRPSEPPHGNTLEQAKAYCKLLNKGGVTYQYGRYEVRDGRYLKRDPGNANVKSWILAG